MLQSTGGETEVRHTVCPPWQGWSSERSFWQWRYGSWAQHALCTQHQIQQCSLQSRLIPVDFYGLHQSCNDSETLLLWYRWEGWGNPSCLCLQKLWAGRCQSIPRTVLGNESCNIIIVFDVLYSYVSDDRLVCCLTDSSQCWRSNQECSSVRAHPSFAILARKLACTHPMMWKRQLLIHCWMRYGFLFISIFKSCCLIDIFILGNRFVHRSRCISIHRLVKIMSHKP